MSTILIVEDHKEFRQEVKRFLEISHIKAAMVEAASGEEGIVKAKAVRPEIILMDFWLGGINGIDAATQIKAILPSCSIIMLTMFDIKTIERLNSKHLIKTFISKSHLVEQLVPNVNKILNTLH